jgi:hypothetical protein
LPLALQLERGRPFALGGGGHVRPLFSGDEESGYREETRFPMLPRIMKWISISMLVLAVLWPSPAGYQILLAAVGVYAGAILFAQTSRTGKYFWEAGHARVSREVKNEN